MVNIAPFLSTAVILSSFNWVTALPQPGNDMSKRDGYSSSSNGMNAPPSMNSNSGYGSSNGSSSGYNSGYDSSSGNQQDYGATATTTMNVMSTTVSYSTMTTETAASTTSVMYGSGSMNSGSDSYNDCVAQCMASYPPLPTATSTNGNVQTYGSSSGSSSGDSSSVGTGATKTITVAPTQGVLRFVPFAMNASVGDTIVFMWGANNHTVTKGSALLPCNATQDGLFTTAQENKGFTFTQKVNSTDPIFFHCATPGHCPKGMFGVINPPYSLDAPTSVSGMMQSLTAQYPSLNDYAAATDNETSGSPGALWGGNIDILSMPAWAHPLMAENVLFTRRLLAKNPEIFTSGSIDMSTAETTPLMYPPAIQWDVVQNAGMSTTSDTPSQASSTGVADAASTNDPVTSPTKPSSGASSTGPKVLALLVAGLVTVLIL